MAGTGAKLARAVEAYFADLGRIRGSGGATGELSYHPALRNLLNAVGAALKLKASCIGELAIPATEGGRNMAGGDFAVTAGWGHYRQGDAVMPGQGRAAERDYSADERAVLGDALPALGETTFDTYLNEDAFWSNVPAAVWNYRLGGYQVLKKWLSYRERDILGRALKPEEVQHFADTARRIGGILAVSRASRSE